MKTRLKEAVPAELLADALGLTLVGRPRELKEVSRLDALGEHSLSFVLDGISPPPCGAGGTVFGGEALAALGYSVLVTGAARLDFNRALHLLAARPGFEPHAEPPLLHPSVVVEPGAVVEPGVEIGEGSRVGSCAVVRGGTRIGKHCLIKAGAVIGDPGFGYERDELGRPIKMLHLGGVRIGDHVEIGSLTTVCKGALGDTVLEDHVKLDDHVHVAHNCRIGEGTMITACAELSGSIKVGRGVWIAPNATLMQKVVIGDGAFVGLGAVVTRSVEAGAKVFGNPAKRIASDAPRMSAPAAAPAPVVEVPASAPQTLLS